MKKHPKIAFDVDGVLTENIYIPKEERSCARYQALKPNKKMIEAVFKFTELGFELGVLSARSCKYPVKCFMDWWDRVESRPIPFSFVEFEIPKLQKAFIAERRGYDVLIDDSIEEIVVCNKTTVKGFLLHNGRYHKKDYIKFQEDNPEIGCLFCDVSVDITNNVIIYLKEAGIYVE